MAKKKKSSKPQQSAAPNISQQILNEAMGGAFGINAFYRAQAKGYTDQDIINAVRSAGDYGVPVSGQLNTIAAQYDSGRAAAPTQFNDSGNSWQGRLMITPNRFNTSKNVAIDPYNGRFTGQRSEFEKAGGSFGYGPMNAAGWLDDKYWGTQVNSNPEVAQRFNTGNVLNPNYDPAYNAKIAAEYPGNTEELRALQATPKNYKDYGLNETDPRYKEIVNDKTGQKAQEYFRSIDPQFAQFMGEGGKFYQAALGGALDPLPGQQAGQASTQMGGTTPAGGYGSLTGKAKMQAIKNAERMGQALKIAASRDSLIGAKEALAIQRKFGKDVDKQVARIDKINLKQAAKKGPIGLTANFTNKYAAGKLGNNRMASMYSFGQPKGGLAQALAGMNDRTSYLSKGMGGDVTPGFGKTPKGFGVMGFAAGKPIYQTAKSLGGWNYNPKPAATTGTGTSTTSGTTTGTGTTTPMGGDFGGGGGYSDSGSSSTMADPKFSPGGASYGVDAGATSLRRKRSSRALAGLTTKGPSQFKIAGQSARSSGLNIGV